MARKEGRNFDQSSVGIQLDINGNHTSFVGNVSVNNRTHDIDKVTLIFGQIIIVLLLVHGVFHHHLLAWAIILLVVIISLH